MFSFIIDEFPSTGRFFALVRSVVVLIQNILRTVESISNDSTRDAVVPVLRHPALPNVVR